MAQEITVCIIAKNEEKYIRTCMEALKPFDVETVVVDTGSQDKTKDIAKEYTNLVYDFEWIGDFAAARNFAAGKASHNYIVAVDCDEFIEKFDIKGICTFLKKNPDKAGRLLVHSYVAGTSGISMSDSYVLRIYDKRFVEFRNRIHEQLMRKDNKAIEYSDLNASVVHMGYMLTAEEKIEKNNRNIELLLLQAKENPDDCYTYYQLGLSYDVIGEVDKAYEARKKAMSLNPPKEAEYTRMLLAGFAKSALAAGDYKAAVRIEDYYEFAKTSADYMFHLGQVYFANGDFEKALDSFELATKCKECQIVGTNSFFPYNAIALLLDKIGEVEEAEKYRAMAEEAVRKTYNIKPKV